MNTIIPAILIAILALNLDKLIPLAWRGGKYLASKFPAVRLPTVNPLAIKVELPIWKVLVLIGLFWVVSSGGVTWPGWKLPGWVSFPSWVTAKPPFITDKLSVLVVEESSARGTYNADQLNVIQSTDAKSVKVAVESKGGRFFVLDKDDANALTNAAAWVKAAFPAVSANPPPWIAGATPKTGFSTPLVTESDAQKRVGGL